MRSLANEMKPIFQIGKGGINDNLIDQVSDALEARELVKVHVLQTALLTAREACDEIAQKTGSEPVQAIGSNFVLYRESKDHKTIAL